MKKAGILCIFSIIISMTCFAVDYYVLGASGSGTEAQLISEHSLCRGVMNSGALAVFIPTKTSTEWTNFVNNPPPGVAVTTCCAKVC